jgi:hypothetical protein
MNTVREHWETVKDAKQELTAKYGEFGTVYLMSLRRRKLGVVEGQVCVASVHVAAMMLAQETHREAEPAEIAAWQAKQETEARRIKAEKANTDSKVNINLGDAVMDILAKAALEKASAAAPPAPAQEPAAKSAPARTSTKTFE